MKSLPEINAIMETIPRDWRNRWCGGEKGPCACMGCVQIGNRIIMAETVIGHKFIGDPEDIDERKIPSEIYEKYKIAKEEWRLWKKHNQRIHEDAQKDAHL